MVKVPPKKGPASALPGPAARMSELDICASEGNDCRKMPEDNNSELVQYVSIKKEYAKDFDPFLSNYGNWKQIKNQKNAKAWKCADCNAKLQVEEVETITLVETPVPVVSQTVKTRRAAQKATTKQETVTLVTLVVSMDGTSSETRNLHAW